MSTKLLVSRSPTLYLYYEAASCIRGYHIYRDIGKQLLERHSSTLQSSATRQQLSQDRTVPNFTV